MNTYTLKAKKLLKKVLSWLHLWLGLASGIVVFVSMLGAAVFVWEEELTDWYYSDLVYLEEVGESILPPSELFCTLEAAYPDRSFRRISLKNDPKK
ncbi:MAG: PepSY domain-containing protein, partial [Bacteroidota bacterium]